ncbi:hypothetical protein [Frigidibacter oleivorans]|uniref:hypothetical protein n=1 Tax=Frigidibacter oleivorans TaxID=2487129 RepID=UPI000F8D616E|nr:hypothetical protein [Frigidibacter oleivorans]
MSTLSRALPVLALGGIGYLLATMRSTRAPAAAARTTSLPAPRAQQDDATASPPATPEVRTAGRKEMSNPPRHWDEVDERLDESFPASDPPASY